MTSSTIHICPTSTGGVSDYVDIFIQSQSGGVKLPLNKALATNIALSGNILLHLSGYGYQKRGAPLWLLHKLKAERANIKTLGVYFHELYAFSPPWRSAFWLSPVQRYVSRSIAEISDYWMTNRGDSARWLERFAADKPHATLPVFSNVGEMPVYLSKRQPKIVVFGGAALRAATYRKVGDSLFDWMNAKGLELHDIGPAMNDQDLDYSLTKADAIVHGRLDAQSVSCILENASFGLVKYPVEYVSKSGVFAAYCAHGMAPILLSNNDTDSDDLVAGKHYFTDIPNLDDGRKTGQAAWEWYQPHQVSLHVSTQLKLLQDVNSHDI